MEVNLAEFTKELVKWYKTENRGFVKLMIKEDLQELKQILSEKNAR